jgi:hypothetical protein
MNLKERAALADIANALGLSTAVEIGTHQAVFAKAFMQRFRGTITLIDPWEGFTEGFDTYYPAIDEDSRDRDWDFEIARSEMEQFGERVTLHRMRSEEAYSAFEDESVGIVYIDGLHEYEDVSRDISLWYPKVQRGGIISGHDFHACLPGVVSAVEEFRKTHGLQVYLTADGMSSWWAIKHGN